MHYFDKRYYLPTRFKWHKMFHATMKYLLLLVCYCDFLKHSFMPKMLVILLNITVLTFFPCENCKYVLIYLILRVDSQLCLLYKYAARHYIKFLYYLIGGSFGGSRGAKPVPPEKGVFPLDHLHECDLVRYLFLLSDSIRIMLSFACTYWITFLQWFFTQEKKEYIACLKSSGYQSEKCRHLSKKYLQCRMERLVCVYFSFSPLMTHTCNFRMNNYSILFPLLDVIIVPLQKYVISLSPTVPIALFTD